jgi:hypothetical protein
MASQRVRVSPLSLPVAFVPALPGLAEHFARMVR